jgi:hypothetical protein
MLSNAKFKPTGHRRPGHKRREYEQPGDSKLGAVFRAWLDESKDWEGGEPCSDVLFDDREHFYDLALELTKDIEYTIDDIKTAVVLNCNYPAAYGCGVFVSALFNQLPDKELIVDFADFFEDGYIMDLGHRLPLDKVVISRSGNLGNLGEKGFGCVVEEGTIGGYELTDVSPDEHFIKIINYAEHSEEGSRYFSCRNIAAPIVNYRNLEYVRLKGILFNFGYVEQAYVDSDVFYTGPTTELSWTSLARDKPVVEDIVNRGIIVNYGKIDCAGGPGLIINVGEIEGIDKAKRGVYLGVDLPAPSASLTLSEDKFNRLSSLVDYIDNYRQIFEPGKDDYNVARAELIKYKLSGELREKVHTEVYDMLKGTTYTIPFDRVWDPDPSGVGTTLDEVKKHARDRFSFPS